MRTAVLVILVFLAAPMGCAEGFPRRIGWESLEPGLDLGSFQVQQPSGGKPGRVQVLRIDLERFELRLLNASDGGQPPRTAREWCLATDAVAALNAGMYQEDYRTSVSLMRTRGHTNNPRLTQHRAVLAFDALDPALPPVKLIDLECEAFDDWKDRYGSMIQSIRMLSCTGENVWEQQPRKWSTAAIGVDGQGRVLFIHVRAQLSVHDLIDRLVDLPLELKGLMYAEGGPQAQLFVGAGKRGRSYEFVGSYDPDLGGDPPAWPIPNVLSVVRRTSPED